MFQVNIANTRNRKILEQRANITVFEYDRELNTQPENAANANFASQLNLKKRQALFQIDQYNSVIGRAGVLQWSAGQIAVASNYNEISEYAKKVLGDENAALSAAKHLYQGNGLLMLDAGYHHLLIEDVGMWNGVVINDQSFYACNASVAISTIVRKDADGENIEGTFDTCLTGMGCVVLKSKFPREELVEVFLNNDELKVDGEYALAWSQSISFAIEPATNAPEDAGRFLHVYRGTGKVLMAPV